MLLGVFLCLCEGWSEETLVESCIFAMCFSAQMEERPPGQSKWGGQLTEQNKTIYLMCLTQFSTTWLDLQRTFLEASQAAQTCQSRVVHFGPGTRKTSVQEKTYVWVGENAWRYTSGLYVRIDHMRYKHFHPRHKRHKPHDRLPLFTMVD